VVRLLVFVKMVPDVAQLAFDTQKNTLIREGVRNYINPHDRKAVEEALRTKEKFGGTVSVVSMGPPQAEEVLKETLAMGADQAYLLTDRAFAGADTLATSTALSLAAAKIGFDLVFGGKYSVDAETSQLMPEVAEQLNANLVTNVQRVDWLKERLLHVEREVEEGFEEFEVELPCVLSVSEKINKARIPSPADRERAKQTTIKKISAVDLSANTQLFGSAGSPTWVKRVFDTSYQRTPVVFDGSADLKKAVEDSLLLIERLLHEKKKPIEAGTEATRSGQRAWAIFLDGETERRTALEILGKLRSLGFTAEAVFLHSVDDDLIRESLLRGANSTIELITTKLGEWSSKAHADGVAQAIGREKPYAVLFPSTVRGREVAARVAASLRLGLTGDAVELRVNEKGELIQIKPAFGGNIMAEILSKTTPQMATIRPGVFGLMSFNTEHPQALRLPVGPVGSEGIRLVSRKVVADESLGDLNRAKVVLCAGYGVSSPSGFRELANYASSLPAAVGATRKVVDLGWAHPQLQIGLTGKSVNPELYLAVAVSGATNHVVGIRRARVVFAINKDPKALIFKSCDVGIVADYKEAMALMKDGLKQLVEQVTFSSG
jgi:electron transfer flavoprotein alpha subunit